MKRRLFLLFFDFFKVSLRFDRYTPGIERRKDVIKKIKAISLVVFATLGVLLIKKIFAGNISSIQDFQVWMNGYGAVGPVLLTFIQAFQVVIPVLPGYLGCAVGALSYGTMAGFWCNYIGICLGSIAAFCLAERYGKQIVTEMFSGKQYEKWKCKIEGKRSYEFFLFMATLLPLFPDDFLCYFSGLIRMDRKKFLGIILFGKPWCILVYSVFFGLLQS